MPRVSATLDKGFMTIFGEEVTARGCFLAIPMSLSWGKGAKLILPSQDSMPAANVDQYLATEVRFEQREKYSLMQCFSERAYLYAFGHDAAVSSATITFIGFLINKDGTVNQQAKVISTFQKAYGAARVSQSTKLAQIQIGDNSVSGFITGLDSGTLDPHHNLQSFTVHLLLITDQAGVGAQQGAGGGSSASSGNGSGSTSGGGSSSSPSFSDAANTSWGNFNSKTGSDWAAFSSKAGTSFAQFNSTPTTLQPSLGQKGSTGLASSSAPKLGKSPVAGTPGLAPPSFRPGWAAVVPSGLGAIV